MPLAWSYWEPCRVTVANTEDPIKAGVVEVAVKVAVVIEIVPTEELTIPAYPAVPDPMTVHPVAFNVPLAALTTAKQFEPVPPVMVHPVKDKVPVDVL